MERRVPAKVVGDQQPDQLHRMERVLGRLGIRQLSAGSVLAHLISGEKEQGGEGDGDEEGG